jgi:hypothetical protein
MLNKFKPKSAIFKGLQWRKKVSTQFEMDCLIFSARTSENICDYATLLRFETNMMEGTSSCILLSAMQRVVFRETDLVSYNVYLIVFCVFREVVCVYCRVPRTRLDKTTLILRIICS